MLEYTLPAKYPNEVLDYKINWARRLDNDSIQSATFAVQGSSSVEISSSSISNNVTTVWLTGGAEGSYNKIEHQVTTTSGRTIVAVLTITILKI